MKLKEYNRLTAIAHHRDYIADVKKFKTLFAKKLQSFKSLTKSQRSTLFAGIDAKLTELCEKWQLSDSDPEFMPDADPDFVDLIRGARHPQSPPRYKRYRSPRVQIDITATRTEQMREIRKQLEFWNFPSGNKAPKKTEYDPWEIYRLYEQHGNYSEVARIVSGQTGNAAYNDELKRSLRKVEKAYNRARAMIEAVTPKTPHS
jgi:hypothetical protein